jgi:hypothetical protein
MAEANRLDAVIDELTVRAEAAELELSQERFMRQSAEAEVARLLAVRDGEATA